MIEEPILAYAAGGEINQVQWSSAYEDWVAIDFDDCANTARVKRARGGHGQEMEEEGLNLMSVMITLCANFSMNKTNLFETHTCARRSAPGMYICRPWGTVLG